MRPSPRTPLLGAIACLAGLVLTGVLSHLVHEGKVRDAAALSTFSRLRDTRLDGLLHGLVHIADTLPYLMLSGAVIATAILRARPRTAVACGVVLLCAPASAQIIKHATAQPRAAAVFDHPQIDAASWPSGHSAGAMALALCAVLVAPAVWRPVVALVGGVLAVGVGYSVVALVWHFPSDAIGGFLLAAAWTLGAVAVLRRHPDAIAEREPDAEPRRRRERAVWLGPVVTVAMFGAATLLVLGSVHVDTLTRVSQYPNAIGAAVLIAALAAVLATVVVLSVRSS